MKFQCITAVFLNALLSYIFSVADGLSYGDSVTLKPDFYYLRWFASGNQPSNLITFELTVRTKGWAGLGFSRTGGMGGADIVVYQSSNGKLLDFHSAMNARPILDQHQNYQLLSATTNATYTVLEIQRKLRTCDSDDLDISNGTTKIIWAFGDENELSFHNISNRGVINLLLLSPKRVDSNQILGNADPVEFLMANVSIPRNKDTWYWCKIFELPKFNQTNYMLGYEPVLQRNNLKHLHHILVYHCTENVANKVGLEGECYEDPHSPVFGICTTRWLAVWAKGEENTVYPENYGFPLQPYSSRYIRLEVHYDNSAFSKDTNPDNSGLRMFLTPKPQSTQVGALIVRVLTSQESLIVPPRMPRFTLYSFCTADCTKNLPSSGIKILSAFFHAHLLGAEFKLRHIRNGTELPPIVGDNNYDPDYQQRRVLAEPVTVLPNDVILMECTFNSVNGTHGPPKNKPRTKATLGGYSTRDEMCSGFLEYYPKVDGFSDCFVALTPETMAKALKTKLIHPGDPLTKPGKALVASPTGDRHISMGNYTQEYDWIVDEKDILTEFQRVTASGKYHLKCGGVDKNIKNGSWVEVNHPVKYPNISAPFPLVEWVDSYICQTSAASLLNLSLTIVIVTTVFLLLV